MNYQALLRKREEGLAFLEEVKSWTEVPKKLQLDAQRDIKKKLKKSLQNLVGRENLG
jgi:hypothetical protein